MLLDLLQDIEFADLMQRHLYEVIGFCQERDFHMGITCQVERLQFDPPLPEAIASSLQPVSLFMLAGYTFESLELYEDYLTFEAGFGPNNFGTLVTVPLPAVLQVAMEEVPLMVNMARPLAPADPAGRERKENDASLSVFLKNPENAKFFKKK